MSETPDYMRIRVRFPEGGLTTVSVRFDQYVSLMRSLRLDDKSLKTRIREAALRLKPVTRKSKLSAAVRLELAGGAA